MDTVLYKLRNYIEMLMNNKRKLIRVMLIILIILLAFVLRVHENKKSDVTVNASEIEDCVPDSIYVDISGSVNTPGVYEMSSGSRLYEVIEKAGGLTDEANTDSINRASFVEDGQKIIIPSVNNEEETVALANGEVITLPDANGLININTAAKEDLTRLTGVGDVIADRIIEYRSSTPFKSIEDIMCVKGIGTTTFEKIKSQITV